MLRGTIERIAAEEGQRVLGWRPVPTNLAAVGRNAAAVAPVFEQVVIGRAASLDGDAGAERFERVLYVIRKRVEHAVATRGAGARPPRLLHREPVGPDPHLQGHADGVAAGADVPGPQPPGAGVGARPGAPAFLDQHLPVVAAGASLSLRRAQRRDQHPAGQRQLDAGPRRAAALERLRRRPAQGAAGHHAGWQRHRLVRQRARVPGDGRPLAAARRADDDSRAVGRQPGDGSGGARLLRVPLVADGAVGRPGIDRLHRRDPDRRRARPQRPAAVALLHHHRRPRDPGLGDRRARRPARPDRAEGAPPPGQDAAHRHGRRPDRRRRRAEARPGRRRALCRLAGGSTWSTSRTCPPPAPSGPITRPSCGASRPSATPTKTCACILTPMALTGEEPIGSMGSDTALAVLSDRPRLLYDYFAQLFAQVTNPPLDAIREELVTSMASTIGPEGNLLEAAPEACRQIKIEYPILHNDQVAKLRHLPPGSPFRSTTLPLALQPRRGRPRSGARDGGAVPQGQPGGGRRLRHPDPVGSRRRRRATRRFRACWRRQACTITWCARARAPSAACWSSRATRARCTTWRCSWVTAPARSTRIWPSRACTTCCARACCRA